MKPPRLVVSVSSLQLAARIKSVLKRIWFALLLPAFMAGNAIAASVAIPNGNFEGLTGTLPTSWTTPYGNGFEYSSTLRVHGGSRSLKIVDTSGSAPGAMRSASIPVIESRLYTAKVWANVDTSNSGPVSLYLEFWNAQGTKMLDYQVDATLALDTWVQLTVADKYAPYGATHCTLMVYSTAPYVGQMFFDDATLEIKDISFATAGVVVADPSFEGGSGSSLPPDWTDYTANGFEAGSTALVNSGSRSVYISDNSASLSGGILSKKFSVVQGKDYTATVKYHITSLTCGTFKMYIQYFDDGEPYYTAGEYLGSINVSTTTTTGSWQTLTANFTPPFLAQYAAILLYSDQACVGTSYFDDATIAAKADGLSNGNFENLDLNNYPHSWAAVTNSGSVVTSSNAVANRVNDISRSFKIVDSSGSLGGGARSNRIMNVTVGQAYTATGKVYVDSGQAVLTLEWWNSSNALLGSTDATVSTTGSWQTATASSTAPANTSYATVKLHSTNANTGTSYFDLIAFAKDVVAVTNRKQLFIDDYIIESLTNVTKTFNQGTKQGIIIPGRPGTWEPNVWMYGSVVDDPSAPPAERYKLYYVGSGKNCYQFSSDGLTWKQPGVTPGVPGLGIFNYGGNTNNNILGDFGDPSAGCVIRDPNEPDANKRWKMIGGYYRPLPSGQVWWYRTYYSSNGINFGNPTDEINGYDVGTAIRNPATGVWAGSYKYMEQGEHRIHRMSQSTDNGNSWSVGVPQNSLADRLDGVGFKVADSYGMGWHVVDGVYIGLSWVFYITNLDGTDTGPIEPQLVFSRDLKEDWHRPSRTSPIPLGASGTWDDGCMYTGNAIEVGNEVCWYYGAFNDVHAGGNANIGMAKWRLDGFMSLNSGGTEGTVVTKQLTYTGGALKLNLQSTGAGNYVKVELLNSSGTPIAGYGVANSAVLNVDSVSQSVTWNGSSALPAAGTVIQVKMYCKNAKVYALKFE